MLPSSAFSSSSSCYFYFSYFPEDLNSHLPSSSSRLSFIILKQRTSPQPQFILRARLSGRFPRDVVSPPRVFAGLLGDRHLA